MWVFIVRFLGPTPTNIPQINPQRPKTRDFAWEDATFGKRDFWCFQATVIYGQKEKAKRVTKAKRVIKAILPKRLQMPNLFSTEPPRVWDYEGERVLKSDPFKREYRTRKNWRIYYY
jgi:hypothetical protein